MRRFSVALATLSVLAAACSSSVAGAHLSEQSTKAPTLAQCTKIIKTETLVKGHLVIATDNPVYAPWFVDNTPSNGLGYESAMAYQLAKELGFAARDVKWVYEPYATSYQPGPKQFDFDINEVVPTAEEAKNVTFSTSYYNVQQSIVAMKSDPIIKSHTPAELKTYLYGALAGSPAAAYAHNVIKPTRRITLFKSLSDAEAALEANAIDALVIDTPTGNHVVTWDIVAAGGTTPLASQVGQFAANGDEIYALVMQLSNPVAACVDVAISAARANGSVARLTKNWLGIYTKVPTIRP